MSTSASSNSPQDKINNSDDHTNNSSDYSVDLSHGLTQVVHMTHNGCCGYEAVMHFLGVKSSVKDFVVNVLSR